MMFYELVSAKSLCARHGIQLGQNRSVILSRSNPSFLAFFALSEMCIVLGRLRREIEDADFAVEICSP